jgi:alpha-L-arabinofuranosidase
LGAEECAIQTIKTLPVITPLGWSRCERDRKLVSLEATCGDWNPMQLITTAPLRPCAVRQPSGRPQLRFARLLLLLGLAMQAIGTDAAAEETAASEVRVLNEVLNPVSERLFGQFLERASFGEPGPEAALIPGTNRLQPAAVAMMQEMRIPVIRFPGGLDVDYLDWRDMLDNAPDRAGERPISYGVGGDPITNRFGIEEYFALRDTLGNETILVVNLLDAVSRKVPLREAALRAAGLVAYANAPLGANLPQGMPDWPAVRARNGHSKPHRAEYVQLGNETWLWPDERLVDAEGRPLDKVSMAAWMRECLTLFIAQIRAVDPAIRIIVDGRMPLGVEREVLADPAVLQGADFAAFHRYEPGPMVRLKRNGEPVDPEALSPTDWWRAWAAMPGHYGPAGQNRGIGPRVGFARDLGYRIAVTEWNRNGWSTDETRIPPSLGEHDWHISVGIGVAGFLHGLMRSDVEIATQSMLVGANWDIAAVHVDTAGKEEPYYSPQAQVAKLYRHHHGGQRLRIETSPLPTYDQPLSMGWMHAPSGTVAFVDVMATRSAKTLYIHAVNRDGERSFPLAVDLSALPAGREASRFTWALRPEVLTAAAGEIAVTTETKLAVSDALLRTVLPPKSVSIVEIGLARE